MKIIFHTEDKDILEICSDYWMLDNEEKFAKKVSELKIKYETTQTEILKIVSECCSVYSEDTACSVCGEMYRFKNRSDFQANRSALNWICDSCEDVLREERQRHEAAQEKKCIDILQADYEKNCIKNIRIEELGVREMIYLLAVIRHSAKEDLSYILPNDSNGELLSPDVEFDAVIIENLYTVGLLIISPCSNLTAIKFENNKASPFLIESVAWNIVKFQNAKCLKDVIEGIESLLESDEFLLKRRKEIINLAKDVALLECFGYLKYVLDEYWLSINVGEKTEVVLRKALDKFSVAQVYRFIWSAAKNAAAFYMRGNVSKRHAANTVVSSIQSQYDKALNDGWDVKPFRRNYNLPQSILSQVLFNTCLKSIDCGFEKMIDDVFNETN